MNARNKIGSNDLNMRVLANWEVLKNNLSISIKLLVFTDKSRALEEVHEALNSLILLTSRSLNRGAGHLILLFMSTLVIASKSFLLSCIHGKVFSSGKILLNG